MTSAEKAIAAVTLIACAVMLVRLCLGAARRQRFDQAVLAFGQMLRQRALRLWQGRALRRVAQTETKAAIERARTGQRLGPRTGQTNAGEDEGEWSGNVYTPKSFRKPRRPDTLH